PSARLSDESSDGVTLASGIKADSASAVNICVRPRYASPRCWSSGVPRMAVREFTDSSGREWRLWDVTPDELNPRTKDEAFLAQLYYTGWIVFETKAGDEKRRLNPIPRAWHELPDHDLEGLLQKAEVVPKRRVHA